MATRFNHSRPLAPFFDFRWGYCGRYRLGIGPHSYVTGCSSFLGTWKIILPGFIFTKGYL